MAFVKLPLAPGIVNAERRAPEMPWTRLTLRRDFLRTGTGERLSVSELSRRTGLPRKTINRVRDGITRPYFTTGAKIVRALGRPNDWLVRYLTLIAPYRRRTHDAASLARLRRREKWQDVI